MEPLNGPSGLNVDKQTEASTLHQLQMNWRPQTQSDKGGKKWDLERQLIDESHSRYWRFSLVGQAGHWLKASAFDNMRKRFNNQPAYILHF